MGLSKNQVLILMILLHWGFRDIAWELCRLINPANYFVRVHPSGRMPGQFRKLEHRQLVDLAEAALGAGVCCAGQ